MLSQLLILFVVPVALCKAQQVIYTRSRPLNSLYPPVTGGKFGTDDRLMLPVARYFPEIDTEVESAPMEETYYPVADTYRLSADGLYAIPAQFVEQQRLPQSRPADDYFAAYDYDNEYAPANPSYVDELYVQPQPEVSEPEAYDDVMVNYLLREFQPNRRAIPEETFGIQRRDRGQNQGVIPITSIMASSGKQSGFQERSSLSSPKSSTASPSLNTATVENIESATDSTVSQTSTSSQSLSPVSSQSSAPSSSSNGAESGVWRSFSDAQRGQKEFPLFRPAKSNHQSMWSSLEEQLSRAKNSNYKPDALPDATPGLEDQELFFVWTRPFNLSDMGDPDSSKTTAGIALKVIGSHKPPPPRQEFHSSDEEIDRKSPGRGRPSSRPAGQPENS